MKKILVVEDESALLDIYVTLLKEEGYEVDGARDGQEGLDKMLTGGYDLVLLDIIMPKLNGKDVLMKYKESKPQNPNKKIVPLTNLIDGPMIDELHSLGAEGFILKSNYTPDQFIIEVKKLLV
ncbi:MAG: response regulator [Patescibacteria group bacterium]